MSSELNFLADAPMTIPANDPFTNETVLPDLIIWIYVGAIVVFGFLLNLIMIGALLRSKCNGKTSKYCNFFQYKQPATCCLGTSIFIVQMMVIDLASLGIASIELLYMNNRKWIFHPAMCPIYLGLDSITTTASVYFIIAINLHAISTNNLAMKTKNNKQESLMYRHSPDFQRLNNENYESALCTHQRSLTIDYSKKKESISVLCPILFIWVLSVSVSIPLFTFGALLPNKTSAMICGIENFNRQTNIVLQLLILFIRIIIPSLCLLVTFFYVANKYLCSKAQRLSNRSCRLNRDVHAALRLGFALSIAYILFSTQRVYGSLMFEVMTKPFMQYKYPVFDKLIGIAFCMVNYAIPALRPFIYLYVNKSLRTKICPGWNENEIEADVR